jgi:hypothetical protein
MECENPKSQAVHTDYNKPLEVQWLCRRCLKRNKIETKPYVVDPLEDTFRIFINEAFQTTNISGKWIASIKRHYQVTTLTQNILKRTQKDCGDILGLGIRYKEVIDDFLKENSNTESGRTQQGSSLSEVPMSQMPYADNLERKTYQSRTSSI